MCSRTTLSITVALFAIAIVGMRMWLLRPHPPHGFGYRTSTDDVLAKLKPDLTGKVALVTG